MRMHSLIRDMLKQDPVLQEDMVRTEEAREQTLEPLRRHGIMAEAELYTYMLVEKNIKNRVLN